MPVRPKRAFCHAGGRFTSKANGVKTGIWECTPGGFDVMNRPNTESCHILPGKVKLTVYAAEGKENQVHMLTAGDSFTLELGSSVRWDVLETVTKFFVIVEHK